MQKDLEYEAEFEQSVSKSKDGLDKDAISKRLEEIYKRLEFIDADAAEARAASILAVCFWASNTCYFFLLVQFVLCRIVSFVSLPIFSLQLHWLHTYHSFSYQYTFNNK